jgi:hypothetical protein
VLCNIDKAGVFSLAVDMEERARPYNLSHDIIGWLQLEPQHIEVGRQALMPPASMSNKTAVNRVDSGHKKVATFLFLFFYR